MRKAKTMIITWLCKGLFIYGVLVLALYLSQRNLMYFPDRARVSPTAVGAENVEVVTVQTADDLKLEGWYFPPATNKPVILLFHGNASSHGHRTYRLRDYLANGYGVLLAGYRGYGGNPGKPTEEGLYQDARTYVRWLQERGQEIILYGESLGTGVAVQMATEFTPLALILEAPYTSTLDIARQRYFFIPLSLLMKDQYRSLDKIGNIQTPLLIIHGEYDAAIAPRYGRALYEAAPEPKRLALIPKAGHDDLYERGAQLHVLDFLRNITEQNR